MKIISWNVNGIRAVYKKGFTDFVLKEDPDILCLQEIKASETELEQYLKIDHRYALASYAQKKGYSGTAIISKKPLKLITHKIGFQQFDSEGRIIGAESDSFLIFNLYMPHGGREKDKLPYKLDCYKKITAYFKKFSDKNLILTGDFNIAREEIDLARPKANKNNIMFTPEERKTLEDFISIGLHDSFRSFHKDAGCYTWWPYFANARERNLGWRIDYIFTNSKIKLKDAFILEKVMGSDHCPVGVII